MKRLIATALCAVSTLITVSAVAADTDALRKKAMDPKVAKTERIDAIKAMYPEMLLSLIHI